MDPIFILFLQLLTPYEVPGVEKIRIGGPYDGGYVVLNLDLDKIVASFSYGVGQDWQFDEQLAAITGAPVMMYDHTIPQLTFNNPLLTHVREGLGATDGGVFKSMQTHVGDLVGQRLFLKCDIEGFEYQTLSVIPDEVLDSFDHIVMEMHSLETPLDRSLQLLSRLNRTHLLVHIHGNNCCGAFSIPEFKGLVPRLVDLTYIHRRLVPHYVKNTQTYPTILDGPTLPDRPEIALNFPPFSPDPVKTEL